MIAIIIILGIIAFDVSYYSRVNEQIKQPKINFSSNDNKITIDKKNSSTSLININGKWKVDIAGIDYPADQKSIDSILKLLKNFKVQDLVSKNKNNYKEFKLDKESASLITLSFFENSKKQGKLFIGKNEYGRRGTYVRIAGINGVYLTKGIFGFIFSRPDFRDLTILSLNKDNIQKITWDYPDKNSFTLEKGMDKNKKDIWFVVDEKSKVATNKSKISNILDKLSNLKAIDMEQPNKSKDYGFAKPFYSISITMNNGDKHILTFGNESDKQPAYYASISDIKDWIYSISD